MSEYKINDAGDLEFHLTVELAIDSLEFSLGATDEDGLNTVIRRIKKRVENLVLENYSKIREEEKERIRNERKDIRKV